MLTKFAVRNYRGFDKKIEWDLSSPSNYTFNAHVIKDGVVKNGIVYGPNGCGKTNLSLAVFDIVNHLTQKFKKANYYGNFINAGDPDGLVEFEYTFKLGTQSVHYCYAKSAFGQLASEALSVDDKLIFEHKAREVFIDPTEFNIEPSFKEEIAQNANNVSVVSVLLSSLPIPQDHYLLKLRDFVNGMLWFRNLDVREFMGLETGVYALDEFIIKRGLVEDFQMFLKDVSGQNFTFVKHAPDDKKLLCQCSSQLVQFDEIASTGTHALKLLYFWIQKMNSATLVFIDEFDAFYHFKLAFEVCQRLFRLDCQLFATSHNTYLMTNELLRPDCNFLLDANVIKPLCDCTDKELRWGHNIEKLFRGNAFKV